jgi:hypothetical protein
MIVLVYATSYGALVPSDAETWTKTPTGYRWAARAAELVRTGRRWALHYRGQVIELGTRATFDHAEGAMLRLDRAAA